MTGDAIRLRRWIERARPPRGDLVRAVLTGFVASALNVALLVGAVALLVESATRPGLRAVAAILVVIEFFAFLRSPLRFAERLSAHRLGYAAVTHWRQWLVLTVGRLDYSRWRHYASGELLERALTDTDQLQDLWLRFVVPAIDTLAVMVVGDVVVALLPPHGHWWGYVVVLVLAQVIGVVALAKLATIELRNDRQLRTARGHFRAQLVELSSAVPELTLLHRTSLAESRIAFVAREVHRGEARLRRQRRVASAVVVVVSLVALTAVVEHPRTSSVWLVVATVIALATYDALVALRAALSAAVEVSGGGERLESLEAAHEVRTSTWPSASSVQLTNVDLVEGERTLLHDVTFRFDDGARVALVGESGVGKSTLLRAVAGLDPTSAGTVLVGDAALRSIDEVDLRRHLGYVTSEPGFTRGYAQDVLTLGRAGSRDAFSDLATLGLVAEPSARFDELSRGEEARVAVARALFTSPQIVLLDEPTAGLGHDETAALLGLLETLGATVIIATHDEQVVAWCDVVVELRDRALHVLKR